MKLLELLSGVKYEVHVGSLDMEINHIQYDSRKILEGDMFVCLKGFEVDGHEYAQKAVDLGAKVIVCENDIEVHGEDITVIKVEEGRKTLATMAANYYGHPTRNLKLIGVTGTNGKTTTVYILAMKRLNLKELLQNH